MLKRKAPFVDESNKKVKVSPEYLHPKKQIPLFSRVQISHPGIERIGNTLKQTNSSFAIDLTRVFSEEEPAEIFESFALPVLEEAIKGVDGLLLVYGGKSGIVLEDQGLVRLLMAALCSKGLKYSMQAYEVHNGHVCDLLSDENHCRQPINIRQDYASETLPNISYKTVTKTQDFKTHYKVLENNTKKINNTRPRTHRIVNFVLEKAKIVVVDLAGIQRSESSFCRSSLMLLFRCLSTDPLLFKDSILTRLLSGFVKDRYSNIAILANLSFSSSQTFEENFQALKLLKLFNTQISHSTNTYSQNHYNKIASTEKNKHEKQNENIYREDELQVKGSYLNKENDEVDKTENTDNEYVIRREIAQEAQIMLKKQELAYQENRDFLIKSYEDIIKGKSKIWKKDKVEKVDSSTSQICNELEIVQVQSINVKLEINTECANIQTEVYEVRDHFTETEVQNDVEESGNHFEKNEAKNQLEVKDQLSEHDVQDIFENHDGDPDHEKQPKESIYTPSNPIAHRTRRRTRRNK